MTIGVLFDAVGNTQADYDAVTEKIAARRKLQKTRAWLSSGIITHVAGPTATGWRVVDVWESEEAFRRFSDEFLRPTLQELGITGGRPEIFKVYNFVKY